jgi:hypothetical protein
LWGGVWGGGLRNGFLNHLKYGIDISQHLTVPEAQHPIALAFQKSRSRCVTRPLFAVLCAIHFDDQLRPVTHEIGNVSAKMNLLLSAQVAWHEHEAD